MLPDTFSSDCPVPGAKCFGEIWKNDLRDYHGVYIEKNI